MIANIAELVRELQRMQEVGCRRVEFVVLTQRAGRTYQAAAVDRPAYRTPDNDVAVVAIAPAAE